MKKTLFVAAVAVFVILIGAGCTSQTDIKDPATDQAAIKIEQNTNQPVPVVTDSQNSEQNEAPVDEYQGWDTFTNSAGQYSFKYSPTWNATVNQYNSKHSLFGVAATSQSGEGGVEINEYTGTLDAYLNHMELNAEVKYLARENVTINGISGIRTNHEGFPASGYSVLLKKDNQVYNIYINSKETNTVKLFDKLVASFMFLN